VLTFHHEYKLYRCGMVADPSNGYQNVLITWQVKYLKVG
jgi:hypothetical protein